MEAKRIQRVAFAALVGGAVGIAFAPIFVRLSDTGPSATAFYRLLLAQPFLWLWMTWEQRPDRVAPPPLTAGDFRQLAVAGFFFAGDLALWHWSIQLTSVANATLFANFAPIFVALGARVLFAEKITGPFLAALTLAMIGSALVVGSSLNLTVGHFFGDLLGIATAVFYAGYLLSVKHLRRSLSTATIMSWSGLAACPVLFVAALGSNERLLPATVHGWVVLVALALISQVVGQSLIAYAFAHLPASFSSLSLLLQPAIAALLAWMILGEELSWLQALGGVVILCGIAAASRQQR